MLAVTVIGNIGNDAEIKEFNGQKFIAFNVASTERYKDRQGNQHSRTTWVSCLKLLPARRQSIPRREVLRRFHRKTKKMIFLFKNIQLTEK